MDFALIIYIIVLITIPIVSYKKNGYVTSFAKKALVIIGIMFFLYWATQHGSWDSWPPEEEVFEPRPPQI